MATGVERHFPLLLTAIETHGGVLFKTVGGAGPDLFLHPSRCHRCSRRGKVGLTSRALAQSSRSSSSGMAHDAGEAMPDACEDYIATPLNRLARLLAADHGTQIQLTSDVRDSGPVTCAGQRTIPSVPVVDADSSETPLRGEPARWFPALTSAAPTVWRSSETSDAAAWGMTPCCSSSRSTSASAW